MVDEDVDGWNVSISPNCYRRGIILIPLSVLSEMISHLSRREGLRISLNDCHELNVKSGGLFKKGIKTSKPSCHLNQPTKPPIHLTHSHSHGKAARKQ